MIKRCFFAGHSVIYNTEEIYNKLLVVIPTHIRTPTRLKLKFIDNITENFLEISHITFEIFFIFSSNFNFNSSTKSF